jgi:hypothetical protein
MKIDVFNGSITFAFGMVGPPMDRVAFLSSLVGAGAEKVSENAGFVHLRFHPEPGVHASALFKDDRFHQLFVLMAMPSDDTGEWTEAHELERMVVHDNWLRQELGKPPYEYAWGSVVSEYDAKGCESEIILTYGK